MGDDVPSRLAVWESDLRRNCAESLINMRSELEKILLYIQKVSDSDKDATIEKIESGLDLTRELKETIDNYETKLLKAKTQLKGRRLSSNPDPLAESSADQPIIRLNPQRQDRDDSGIGSFTASTRLSDIAADIFKDIKPEDDSSSSRSSYSSVPEDNDQRNFNLHPTDVHPELTNQLSRPTIYTGSNIVHCAEDQHLTSSSDNETVTEVDQGLRESVFIGGLDPEEKQFLEEKTNIKPRNNRNKTSTDEE